ncbi:MAG TPA: TonB-dependent receptor [Gemmatimonadales bacterium]|nr:TonB-dependent receptor [Gemmatimonadales bacterium]
MTHRVRNVLGQLLGFGVALAIVLFAAVAPAAAQQTSGKIEGTVTDQAGGALANAQVIVVGTSFGSVTDAKGYYFINNIPVGSYTLRAQFIGYAPHEVQNVRILGGQTITQNIPLSPSAVVVSGVTVTGASNPLVPRDEVASKSIISGDAINSLPMDDVRNIIAVQPGVVESGAALGVSIRGSRPGEQNVYIDGAPVRNSNSGGQGITVGTNGVEEASVTTGALGVDFGDAQSGVISFTTRSGGQKLSGSMNYQTDEPFGNSISLGLNRFEGSLGGPIPGASNLRFFVSGVLQGQLSQAAGLGQNNIATYVMGGIDTTVTDGAGRQVGVPNFIQYGGQCDAATNFGFDCQGIRLPMNWSTNVQTQGKVSYTYGGGSSISLTGLANGLQGRNGVGAAVGDPSLYGGYHTWQRLAVLNLNHSFFKSAERELALNLNFSFGSNDSISGPLDPTDELGSRSPSMGLHFSPLNFSGFGDMPFPITDQIIRNIRSNSGLRVPYLNNTDLRNVQGYRINPYGLNGSNTVTSFPTAGSNATVTLYDEKRYRAFGEVDWQANRFHRFNFGGEWKKTNLAYFNSNNISQIFMDAYVVHPVTYAAWASDRLDLGDVVLELGGRYDYMNSHALFSNTPGRIFSNPAWQTGSGTNDAAYTASLAATMTPAQVHHTISPRLRVSFPVTEKTDFRLSYSHQVQTPDFATLVSGANNDLSFTNTNDAFGRDVGFGKTIQFEFGVRHAFSPDLVLDVAAYNKDFVNQLTYRIVSFDDPANPGRTQNLNILTTADFGYARGIDFKLDKRIGTWLAFSGGYTFQVARSTGSDPFSYLNTSARQISQVTGDRVPPPEQPLPTNDNRAHNFVGSLTLNVPSDWQKGTTLGAILGNVGVFTTFRAVSGLPFTRLRNVGGGATAPRTGFGLEANSSEPINSSTMPWTKFVDLRVNKGVKLGSADVTAFADFRNLLNFKNVTGLYAETDDVTNALYQTNVLSPEFSGLRIEAQQNGHLLSGGAIDLVPSCGTWTGTNAGPVDCVVLRQVEARFGNGDGVYSLDEQTKVLNAFYERFRGPHTFYGQGRQVRVGFELNF